MSGRTMLANKPVSAKHASGGKFASGLVALGFGLTLALSAQAAGTLRVANFGEPTTLDPHGIAGVWENRITGDMFMGLVTEAADLKAIPGAAESWTISEDGTVYTFKLRDATWSDGVPVTADDFVFSLRRILSPEQAARYASLLYPIKNAEAINSGKEKDYSKLGVRAIDPKTLEITLEQSTPYFLGQLVHYTAFPLPKHVVEKFGKDWIKPGNMVSNGAFMLSEYVPNDHVKLVKNPKFYDAANVKLDAVVFYPTEERNEMLKRFRAKEIDLATDFDSGQIDFLKKELPNETKIAPYLGTYYYPINDAKGPTADIRVRKALSYAMDRETITDKVMKTGEIPAYTMVPPGIPTYPGKPDVPWAKIPYAQRLDEAKKLMTEAGYGPGKPLKLELKYNTSEAHKRIAVALQQMWKAIGVEVELVNSDVKTHYKFLEENDFQVARAGWIADYNDAQNFLFLFETRSGKQNYSRYSNKTYDDAMIEASKTTDLAKRAAIMVKAEQVLLDDFGTLPIYTYVSKNLVQTNVVGVEPNVQDIHRSRWISLK